MARNLAYYMDPEEEARKRALLEEEFGPPAPLPNLGVAPVPRLPIDTTTPRRTDGSYADFHDPYQDEEPTEEELAADVAETEPAQPAHPFDVLLAPNPYAEAGQAAAEQRRQEAPASVDKTAASVSAEQKGVPAAQTPLRDLALDTMDAVAGEPSARERTYTNDAERMLGSPQRGERSDLFGFDDEEGFSRKKLIDRVRELYGEESRPETPWEDEFLASHKGRSDSDIERAWLLQSLWSGNEHGMRFRQMLKNEQQGYEKGLAEARASDAANRRISRGMAEAIAATGQVSPEAAVQLRMNDKLVKDFGQFASQGGRAEGQGIGLSKEKLKLIAGMIESGDKEEAQKGLAMLRAATQLGQAEIYANKGQATTPEAKAINDSAAASVMAQALGENDPAIGARALANDFTGLSAKQRGIAMRLGPQLRAKAAQNKGLDQVLNDSIRTQATQPIKDAYSIVKSIEIAKNNRQQRTKFKTDWNDASIAFKEAWQGWKSLSPDGKAALAEWAAGGWTGKIRSFLMQPGDQERIAAVQGVINALVKDRSGSAVTGSEWERIATEIGLTADDWNPFNKPEAIEKFLKISGDKLTSHRRVFEQEYGWKPREAGDDGR